MFRLRYILFLLGFMKKSTLLSISESFSKSTITSDVVKNAIVMIVTSVNEVRVEYVGQFTLFNSGLTSPR